MNYATTDKHIPEAKQNNCTLQERIRAKYHNLPYKAMARLMVKHLAMIVGGQLNMFPAKGGVSTHYSPYMILKGKAVDFNKHCQVPFGAYVQANNQLQPTNTNTPQTINCMHLRPTNNHQGRHELMDLGSGHLVTWNSIKELPITDLVIKAVKALATTQHMKSLKFSNCHKIPIHPADWIKGVDYKNDDNKNKDDADNDYYGNNIDQDNYKDGCKDNNYRWWQLVQTNQWYQSRQS